MSMICLHDEWGISVKTLQRWRNERYEPRFLTIGKLVSYPFKDIEYFETNALYEDHTSKAIDKPLSAVIAT